MRTSAFRETVTSALPSPAGTHAYVTPSRSTVVATSILSPVMHSATFTMKMSIKPEKPYTGMTMKTHITSVSMSLPGMAALNR